LHLSNVKYQKRALPQIKADKSKEMDADKYLKHLYFRYRDDDTGNIISRKAGINSIRYAGSSHIGLINELSAFIYYRGLRRPPLPAKPSESPLHARRARIWIPTME
jgi:hypothetical protein